MASESGQGCFIDMTSKVSVERCAQDTYKPGYEEAACSYVRASEGDDIHVRLRLVHGLIRFSKVEYSEFDVLSLWTCG